GDGESAELTIDVFDSLGNVHPVTLQFTKQNGNEWNWQGSWVDESGNTQPVGDGELVFNDDGALQSVNGGDRIAFSPQGAQPLDITIVFNALTQYAAETTVDMLSQNGYPSGVLEGITIDSAGVITGTFTNGISQ